MNEDAKLFRPEAITVELGGDTYELVYDLNAFCELEKTYDSVDSILQMLLGASNVPDLEKVTYDGAAVAANTIAIAGVPLPVYINKVNKVREVKNTDTLLMLWAGCLHNHCKYDEFGEISGYTITKAQIGSQVSFKNIREVNGKILTSILRDLIPAQSVKNAEAPETMEQTQEVKPKLTLLK